MADSKVIMTFDDYDSMVDDFQHIRVKTHWPDMDAIDILRSDPKKYLAYACYLDEMGKKPTTKDEDYRKKTLRMFIMEHLELVESEE